MPLPAFLTHLTFCICFLLVRSLFVCSCFFILLLGRMYRPCYLLYIYHNTLAYLCQRFFGSLLKIFDKLLFQIFYFYYCIFSVLLIFLFFYLFFFLFFFII